MLPGLRHHRIFLITFAFGVLVGALLWGLPLQHRVLAGADAFFGSFLLCSMTLRAGFAPDRLRRGATTEDEGMPLIIILSLGAIAVSVGAIFWSMNAGHSMSAGEAVLALMSVPLGWMMVHLLMAFHYARLWYLRGEGGDDLRGLDFPGADADAQLIDFLYFSYTIGMTYQTSDVGITRPNLRRTVVWHAGFSFFYNTVIMALAVNAVVSLGQ